MTRLELAVQEVHVWSASLEQTRSLLVHPVDTLSPDERARADRFRFERDRRRFVVARAHLRTLLARYLDTEPQGIVFTYEAGGKPQLGGRWIDDGLQFNIAHSHDLALYAFTRGRSVGVDVEYGRHLDDMDHLARLIFSPRELLAFHALPCHHRRRMLFTGWTLKEALVKATGEGLARPLNGIDISLLPGRLIALVSIAGDVAAGSRWTIRELTPAPGYSAAIAVDGHVSCLACQHFVDDRTDRKS